MELEAASEFHLGINACNISSGGGFTHILELLTSIEALYSNNIKVTLWASEKTLSKIPNYCFLVKNTHWLLQRGSMASLIWQWSYLTKSCYDNQIDILLSPGGTYSGKYEPSVCICQNMLPFQMEQAVKFKFSLTFLRMVMLRFLQSKAFSKAAGVIFLSEFAKLKVSESVQIKGDTRIIKHGISRRFYSPICENIKYKEALGGEPLNLLYVSTINVYKNQDKLISAVAKVRKQLGLQIHLHLVGSAYPVSLRLMNKCIKFHDPENIWCFFHGEVQYQELHHYYHNADFGIFLSSCENLPIILLEMMAAGLPIISSDMGPMPEVLGDSAYYCDPECELSILNALAAALNNKAQCEQFSADVINKSQEYSWETCAMGTVEFLRSLSK